PRPARVDVERLQAWLDRAAVERDGEHRRVRRLVERAAEIRGLRDYRSGDPPRRIDWKATARRNRLTVREYEDTVPPRLTLIVEPWLPAAAAPADHERLERVLSLAAGICRAWRRAAGAHLTLVLTGPEPVGLDGPPGAAFTQSLLIALALEPGGPTADPTEVIQSLPSGSRLAPILFLSARPASPLAALVERLLGRPAACLGPDAAADWFQLETDPVRQRPVAT
ncbi:MAG: DUF58 domain-containing protein, partial [Gemmataceae bacterium]|nr:DUF58 domain-containing protein [Gemmataceae bacterium]